MVQVAGDFCAAKKQVRERDVAPVRQGIRLGVSPLQAVMVPSVAVMVMELIPLRASVPVAVIVELCRLARYRGS
jgi:hypothetical protein